MKKLVLLMLCCAPLWAVAQTTTPAANDPAERNKMLYSLGFLLGDNLKKQLILDNEDDYKAVSQGMRDSLLGKASQTDIEAYKPQILQKYQEPFLNRTPKIPALYPAELNQPEDVLR